MDFEPFHSDEDEELASIVPEKKKKDGDKWKKPKSGPKFRNEKKMAFNDIHVSPGIKGKHSVHGVVGPADYIYDQGNLSTTTEQSRAPQVASQLSTAISSSAPPRPAMLPQPALNSAPQKQVTRPDVIQSGPVVPKQNTIDISQPHIHNASKAKQFSRLNSSPSAVSFTPNFPPVSPMQAKIDRDRPHFPVVALPPDASQGPTPFKYMPQSKLTLLSQAATVTQFQSHSVVQQPPVQVTAGNEIYQRSQTFDSAVSAPSKPIAIPSSGSNPEFNVNYENVGDRLINSSQEYVESPAPETGNVFTQGPSPSVPFTAEGFASGTWSGIDNNLAQEHRENTDCAEWANFHPSLNVSNSYDGDNSENRRKSRGTDSLSESIPESMSSIDSELEESVWKINSEQYEYYTNQFKKIQPNIDEVIKGPQARDFFLKSNLPNETLSTVWQLSDMDKDAALNLYEFCIAMHLVVAVRHGLDLPTTLPHTLLQPYGSLTEELSLPLGEDVQPVIDESDDEIKNSSMSDEASLPSSAEVSLSNLAEGVRRSSLQDILQDRDRSSSFGTDGIPVSPVLDRPNNAVPSVTPIKEISSSQAAIARPRASAQKNINLMDSAPWQLLPPPTKGKPLIKKTLNLDDDVASMSNESIEQVNSFSNSEQSARASNEFYSEQEFDDKSSTSNEKTLPLSKEKSRSIDSLRQDMNEDYTSFEMRRLSRDSRPRSYSGEGTQFNNRFSKDIEIPPIPPPRYESHSRTRSVDFHIKDSMPAMSTGSQEIRPSTSALNADDSSEKGSSHDISLKEKSLEEAPPRGTATDSVRHVVRFSDHLDVMEDGTSKSINKRMTKHELQTRVHLLKNTNVTLNNLLSQLHMEWKSASEERIALDILLQKKKQDLS